MTPREARRAIYGAALAIDEHVFDTELREDALDILDEALEAVPA